MYKLIFKHCFDLIFGVVLLVIVAPLLLLSALLICIESKGPIFYIQPRLGQNCKIFNLYKLRSMVHHERLEHAQVEPGNAEITRVGRIIRRLKIDELPQLINIIKGDMSFVGPRPCLPELLEKFDENAKYRIKERPGLTGLAQINGNIYLTWPERWVYDRRYVEELNFWLDCFILIKTVAIIIFGEKAFLKKWK